MQIVIKDYFKYVSPIVCDWKKNCTYIKSAYELFFIQLFYKKHIVKLKNTKSYTSPKGSEFRICSHKVFGMREALVRCLIMFMAMVKILMNTQKRSLTQHRKFVYTSQGQLTCRIKVVINESWCLNCRMKETVVKA